MWLLLLPGCPPLFRPVNVANSSLSPPMIGGRDAVAHLKAKPTGVCPGWIETSGIGFRIVRRGLRYAGSGRGRPFEVGNQVLISSHRKLLLLKATVVNVAETSGQNSDRHA